MQENRKWALVYSLQITAGAVACDSAERSLRGDLSVSFEPHSAILR